MKFFTVVLFMFCATLSFAQDSAKVYRFVFRAGAATGINFYKAPGPYAGVKEHSYKIGAFGNGLGAELAYRVTKFMDINAHYYFYVYKNQVDFDDHTGIPVIDNLNLKQQSQMIAFSADFKLYHGKRNKISMGSGPGFALNRVQYIHEAMNTPVAVGERKNIKFVAPLYIGIESYIKGYIVLGARAQTFIWGEQKPFRTINLFSYLGMRF